MRSRPFYLLSLLACWLTLAASGDDFSLTRLAFCDSVPDPGALPPDDPNNDFVEAASLGPAHRLARAPVGLDERTAAPALGLAPAPALALPPALPHVRAAHRPAAPAPPTVPLRC